MAHGWPGAGNDPWGANDGLYEPARLYGASPGPAPTEFRIDELGTDLCVTLRRQIPEGSNEAQMVLEVSFKDMPTLKAGTQLLRIDLFDRAVSHNISWYAPPLVIVPRESAPTGPWQILERDHPGLSQRYDQWWHRRPSLDVEVWVGSPAP